MGSECSQNGRHVEGRLDQGNRVHDMSYPSSALVVLARASDTGPMCTAGSLAARPWQSEMFGAVGLNSRQEGHYG